jgi:hypothetical protein
MPLPIFLSIGKTFTPQQEAFVSAVRTALGIAGRSSSHSLQTRPVTLNAIIAPGRTQTGACFRHVAHMCFRPAH